ncbi:hypothetical protein MVES_002982 [Malassezia vespertilionis]|uniref:AB hydrolase-1 domain-containing protein n=1 Tax=Malassezia vespertilionis TaxID=2020962 RepID=A0A2N1J923_9BASI|nr:hypothetical protein MVES_002982 [Malassezia vespertilionis]
MALAKALVYLTWTSTPLAWAYAIFYIALRACYTQNLPTLVRHILQGTLPVGAQKHARLSQCFSLRILFFYSVLEAFFSLYYARLIKKVQKPKFSHTASREYVVKAITSAVRDGLATDDGKCDPVSDVVLDVKSPAHLPRISKRLDYDDPRAVRFRKEMNGWFIGIDDHQITSNDLRAWFSWSLFGKHYAELKAEVETAPTDQHRQHQLEFIEDAVALFSARSGLERFPDDVNLTPAELRLKRIMLLTLDPVEVNMRPLALYATFKALNMYAYAAWAWRYGLERHTIGSVDYLIYIPPGWRVQDAASGAAPLPLVFLHGLGIGIAEYFFLVRAMFDARHEIPARPVLIPLQPWTSADIFSARFLEPWNADECASLVLGMFERYGFQKCGVTVLSHSMGTILHAWLLKRYPTLLKRSTFVDPVCFQLWAPHLCYRFLYKKPASFVEYSLRYFVAREVGTANVLMRNFDWSANVLLLDEIPHRTDPQRVRIYLAGSDTVVDAPLLRDFLCCTTRPGCTTARL